MSTTHRESLAVLWAVLILCPSSERARFTMRMDHEALRWIVATAETTGKLSRWSLGLSEFDFDIMLRAGVKNQAADALLHLMISGEDKKILDDEVRVLTILQEILACAPRPDITDHELIEEFKRFICSFYTRSLHDDRHQGQRDGINTNVS